MPSPSPEAAPVSVDLSVGPGVRQRVLVAEALEVDLKMGLHSTVVTVSSELSRAILPMAQKTFEEDPTYIVCFCMPPDKGASPHLFNITGLIVHFGIARKALIQAFHLFQIGRNILIPMEVNTGQP